MGGRVETLQSWNEGPAKAAVRDFVERVTRPGSPGFLPEAERIAVFDNDGTLWAEQPAYVQFTFALDRIRELAPKHPHWRERQPFRGVLEGDLEAALQKGESAIAELVAASHAGMTTDEFAQLVGHWLKSARHPRFDRPYTDLVYQPMLELLDCLRGHGFSVYIVSGGGVEFMRQWAERVYGVPPAHVIGSSIVTELVRQDDGLALVRRPEVEFVDDGPGKPVGIHKFVGRRPVVAVGNADGDKEMLEWVSAAPGPTLSMLVHHTDAAREWSYDRSSQTGRLDEALDLAPSQGWVVVDMKRDWKKIFPFEGSCRR